MTPACMDGRLHANLHRTRHLRAVLGEAVVPDRTSSRNPAWLLVRLDKDVFL